MRASWANWLFHDENSASKYYQSSGFIVSIKIQLIRTFKMKCHLTFVFVIALNANAAQSLLTFHHPKLIRPSPLRRQVGLSHEPYPHDDIIQDTSRNNEASPISLSAFEKVWRTYAMIAYVAHMCVAIPLALLPTYVKMRLELSPKTELEHEALQVGQACARTLLEMIPFMNLTVIPHASTIENPTATIWVANHVSMLDTFVFLAADEKLRGKHRRPVKVLYVSPNQYYTVFTQCLALTPSYPIKSGRV